jgi:hypothetical protein
MDRERLLRSGLRRRAPWIAAVSLLVSLLIAACGLLVDDAPPSIALVDLASGSVVEQPEIAVAVRVRDERSAVVDVVLRTDSGSAASCVGVGGDRFECGSVPLVVGDNVLTVTARDAPGNVAEMRFVLQRRSSATTDDVPPTIVITDPSDGDVTTASDVVVKADVVDAGGVASVSFVTDHGASGACTSGVGAAWTCGPIPVPVGSTTISLSAEDLAGNVAGATVTVTREDPGPSPDVTPPSVEIVSPVDGATISTAEVTVTAVVSDDRGVAAVTFATDHGGSGSCVSGAGDGWTCGPVALPIGDTTIGIRAVDAAGNVADTTVTVTREEAEPDPDETPPTVAIVDPLGGATVTVDAVIVSVEASDDRGVASVSFATDHGAIGACAVDIAGIGYACGPVPLPLGFTVITVTASDRAGNSASASVTVQRVSPPTPAFDIDIVFFDESFTATQRAAFVDAAARWEQLVVGDLEDVAIDIPANGSCGLGEPAVSGTVDDLLIFATSFTEGVGGLLGSAGPCLFRWSGTNPGTNLVGIMRFDTADLANLEAQGALVDVIVHEMGHVLGFGTNWEFPPYFDVLDYVPSGVTTNCRNASGFVRNPTYVGTSGTAAWSALGGSGAVPVEETGGPGTQCGHWDEEVFGSELMTGYLNLGGPNPLSAMTVRSLEDLGLSVDPAAADPYVLPPEGALRVQGALNLMAAEELLFPRGAVDPATGRLDVLPRGPGPR